MSHNKFSARNMKEKYTSDYSVLLFSRKKYLDYINMNVVAIWSTVTQIEKTLTLHKPLSIEGIFTNNLIVEIGNNCKNTRKLEKTKKICSYQQS